MNKKICNRCKKEKLLNKFYKSNNKYQSQCKSCILEKWQYSNYQIKEKKYCVDCGKQTDSRAKQRCYSCEMKSRKIVKAGANHHGWKGGLPKCIDCGKQTSYNRKRCMFCYINSLSKKKYFCVDCKKQVSFKSRRCHSCGRKYYMKINKINFYGNKNPNYRNGGINPLSNKIRELLEYKQWRLKVFNRDNYTCQECFKIGGKLEAHHKRRFNLILKKFIIKYSQFSPFEDKETLVRLAITYKPFWKINNGQTLCEDCHDKTKVSSGKRVTEANIQL